MYVPRTLKRSAICNTFLIPKLQMLSSHSTSDHHFFFWQVETSSTAGDSWKSNSSASLDPQEKEEKHSNSIYKRASGPPLLWAQEVEEIEGEDINVQTSSSKVRHFVVAWSWNKSSWVVIPWIGDISVFLDDSFTSVKK